MFRKAVLCIFGFAAVAHAQYARMDFSLTTSQGVAIAGASVLLQTQSACGTATGGTSATVYPAATGGTPVTNPLTTDGFGHAFGYVSPGCYTITYSSPLIGSPAVYPDQAAVNYQGIYCSLTGCTMSGALITPGVTAKTPIVDCRFFGTAGNGVWNGSTVTSGTDDTAAIQACWNFAAANGYRAYLPSAGAGFCYKITNLIAAQSGASGSNAGWPSNNPGFEAFGDGQDTLSLLQSGAQKKTTLCSTSTTAPSIQVNTLAAGSPTLYSNYTIHDFNVVQSTSSALVPVIGINGLTYHSSIRHVNVYQAGTGSGVIWENIFIAGVYDSDIFANTSSCSKTSGTVGLWLYNDDSGAGGGGDVRVDNILAQCFNKGQKFGWVSGDTSTGQTLTNMLIHGPASQQNAIAYTFADGIQGAHMDAWHSEFNTTDSVFLTAGASNVEISAGDTFEPNETNAEFLIDTVSMFGIHIHDNYLQSVNKYAVSSSNLAFSNGIIENNTFIAKSASGTTCFNVGTNTSYTYFERGDVCSGFGTATTDSTSWAQWAPYCSSLAGCVWNQGGAGSFATSIAVAGGTAMSGNQGNGTKIQHSTGATSTNDCLRFDANGNSQDAGFSCAGSTGSGNVVQATSPTLVTPAIGTATATSLTMGGTAVWTSGAGAASGNCTVGSLYTNTTAASASTVLYLCQPANTWTAVTVP